MRLPGRRALLLGGILGLAGCVAGQADLTPADAGAVARVQAWLDGLTSLHARFLQTWPNGAVSEGTVLFQPPGRLRLDYAPNDRMVLVADGGRIVLTDNATGAVTRTPARASPLGLLLDGRVRLLGDGIRVTDVQQTPGRLQLSLVRADNPLAGLLTLVFADRGGALTLTTLQGVDGEHRLTTFRFLGSEGGQGLRP